MSHYTLVITLPLDSKWHSNYIPGNVVSLKSCVTCRKWLFSEAQNVRFRPSWYNADPTFEFLYWLLFCFGSWSFVLIFFFLNFEWNKAFLRANRKYSLSLTFPFYLGTLYSLLSLKLLRFHCSFHKDMGAYTHHIKVGAGFVWRN